MEAVPKLSMLSFSLKTSPEGTSFSNLKKYIAESYQEEPESFSKEIYALESLRNSAMRPSKDVTGCATLKRYYCQLHSLVNRFPHLTERNLFTFTWKDLYLNNVSEVSDLRYEIAAVLFNIAAHNTQLGSEVARSDADGMKLACTLFQCAAWAFGELREKFSGVNSNSDFMAPELLVFMQQVSFAQAQECILEKSLIDNRKPTIVAKVTAQIINYYGAALAALLTGGDDGAISEVVGNNVLKEWKKYIKFKILYLNCILYLYQGQQAEEQQKMGERVALFQASWDKLEETRKESKGMPGQKEIQDALNFTADVVEAKRKAAKNENEFIYHEAVPEISDLSAVQGANLVNGISFSVTDAEVAGEDIFSRLIPMKAHEASSMYSEEKAQLLRRMGVKIEEKDTELTTFMSSLNLEYLNISEEKNSKIPQGIVDRCAALNAKTNAIPDLIGSMSNLAEICSDVETNLKEIKELLTEEEQNEKLYQQTSGVHRSNVHFTELSREFHKYSEAHQKAGDSNDTLRRAMELHVNNLRILARPLQEIQSSVPKLSGDLNDTIFRDLKLILNKVNEMKAQRAQFHADLRIAVNDDDITAKIIACGSDKTLKDLFKQEISKHDKICALIDQNLVAQGNILSALTDAYAKSAPILKTISEAKHKKENFFSSLAASYDVYEDLLAKSAKGLEFYKKLQGNVQKLVARVRAARDVQDEERSQRLKSVKTTIKSVDNRDVPASGHHLPKIDQQPKLKDFLKSGKLITNTDQTYVPLIRPNPLGSEAPTTSACVTSVATSVYSQSQYLPSDPPPPYSVQPYGMDLSGYTNPIYQNSQMYDTTLKMDPNASSYNYGGYDPQTMYQTQQPASYQNPPAYSATSASTVVAQQMPQKTQQPTQYQQYSAQQYQSQTDPVVSAAQYPQQQQQQQPQYQPQSQAYQYPTQSVSYPTQSYDNSAYVTSNAAQQVVGYQQQSFTSLPQSQSLQQISQSVASQPQVQSVTGSTSMQTSITQDYAMGLTNQMDKLSMQNAQTQSSQSSYYAVPPYSQYDGQMSQSTGNYYQQTAAIQNTTPVATSAYNQQVQPQSQTNAQQNSYNTHPGYVFNQLTGEYQYGSGYQTDTNASQMLYTQYTNPPSNQNSQTTDSANLSSSGQSYAIQYANQAVSSQSAPTVGVQQYGGQDSYFSVPYGYQSQGGMPTNVSQPVVYVSQPPPNINNSGMATYIQSNNGNSTNTTISGSYASTASESAQYNQQQSQQAATNSPVPPAAQQPTTTTPQNPVKQNKTKKSSNIDLLSDIDFSSSAAAVLSVAPLQPQIASQIPEAIQPTKVSKPESEAKPVEQVESPKKTIESTAPVSPAPVAILSPVDELKPELEMKIDRKSSCDNLSICSDLSSLDHSFDWDSISLQNESTQQKSPSKHETPTKYRDPFEDQKVLKYFHKEVERYEKAVDSLNIKMLNGNTPLVSKWKELQDLLVKDEDKRTTSIGKLFPEKNRSTDCIPFDHARVVLERSTDNYINAAYVKDLGANCPTFILAQTPMQNTVNDFWSMIWSEKARTVVCLHTPNEILDTFWPQEPNKEVQFDDYSVTLIKQFDLSHCIELNLKLTMNGADAILDLSLIQIKSWTKNLPTQMLGIAQNILAAHKQRSQEFKSNAPLIMNCLTGSERSGLVALAICTILATQTRRPILINVVDVWYRICSQRKGALRDTNNLQLSMQVVLSHAHDVLNKRGIMTSYQMKNAQTATIIEKEEVKDPLMDLDPLWKLKQK